MYVVLPRVCALEGAEPDTVLTTSTGTGGKGFTQSQTSSIFLEPGAFAGGALKQPVPQAEGGVPGPGS